METNDEVVDAELDIVGEVVDIEESLRKFSYWSGKQEEVDKHAKEEYDKIDVWRDSETEKINKKLSWHRRCIEAYLGSRKITSGNFVNGKIRTTKGRDVVVVNDHDAFKEWVTKNQHYTPFEFMNENIVQTPSKTEIMNYIKKTGEIPSGVDFVTTEDKIRIKPPASVHIKEEDFNFE